MSRSDLIMRAVRAAAFVEFEFLMTDSDPAHAARLLYVYTDHATRLPGFLHASICQEYAKLAGGAA